MEEHTKLNSIPTCNFLHFSISINTCLGKYHPTNNSRNKNPRTYFPCKIFTKVLSSITSIEMPGGKQVFVTSLAGFSRT